MAQSKCRGFTQLLAMVDLSIVTQTFTRGYGNPPDMRSLMRIFYVEPAPYAIYIYMYRENVFGRPNAFAD